jgi:glyoxylase-like metal-dependent hydrolase (beta-lactamase superfamily II)
MSRPIYDLLMRLSLAAIVLSAAAWMPASGGTSVNYEVFAIRYATIPQFPVASLVQGAEKDRKLDIAMMVWLVRGGGHNILVDSGFYRDDLIRQWKPADYVRPDAAVARAGVNANEITDVIITHAHWDHADGADLFPKATIWIQKAEYDYYSTRAGKDGITKEDIDFFHRANDAGRLRLVDGDREILPGINVYTGGRHTYASQYIGVTAAHGPVILASDNVYLYENLDKHVPIAQTFDAVSNLAAQDRMKSLAGDVGSIVPGHDPAVMTRFPRVAEGVVRIR